MSLTFSDRGTTATAKGFRRALLGVGVVLAVVIALAGFSTLSEGPRLRSSTIDESSAVRTAQAVLTLRSDRALGPVDASAIRVSPEAEFSIEQGDLDLRLVFEHPLEAGVSYTVVVDPVRARGAGAPARWEVGFATPAEELLFLRPAGDHVELVRFRTDQADPEVLHRAPGITGFTRVGVVYAVHRVWQGESILELVDPSVGGVDRIAIAPDQAITQLASAAWGTSLVVTMDASVAGQAERKVLALVDTVGTRTPEIVAGIDGGPLRVIKFAVSPVTGNIVAWLRDRSLVVYEPLTQTVIPVGEAAELWGFTSTGEGIVFVDALGTLAVDLRTREETRIPAGRLDTFPVFHEATTLSPRGVSFQRVVLPGIDEGPDFSLVTRADSEGAHRLLYGSSSVPGSIGALQLSPNGQFLALESNPTASVLGFAGLNPEVIRDLTSVVVIDVATGQAVLSTAGYAFAW